MTIGSTISETTATCPLTWVDARSTDGRCYKYFSASVTFFDALRLCFAISDGLAEFDGDFTAASVQAPPANSG